MYIDDKSLLHLYLLGSSVIIKKSLLQMYLNCIIDLFMKNYNYCINLDCMLKIIFSKKYYNKSISPQEWAFEVMDSSEVRNIRNIILTCF